MFYEFFWSGDDVGWYWICIHLMIPIRVQFNDSVSFILGRSYHLIRRDIRLSVDSFEIIFSDYEKDWWVWLFIIDFEVDWKLFKKKNFFWTLCLIIKFSWFVYWNYEFCILWWRISFFNLWLIKLFFYESFFFNLV